MAKDIERHISTLLQRGALLSGLLLSVGWISNYLDKGDQLHEFTSYKIQKLPETLHWIVLAQDKASMFSYLGVVALLLIPLIRVLLSSILFFRKKEYILAVVSMTVFCLLILSFQLGLII
jgi:uncharacterized membrane protein